MVHRQMLPCHRRHLENRKFRRRSQGATLGRRTDGGGRSEHETVVSGGRFEEGGNSGRADYDRSGGHVVPLPPVPAPMVPGQEDMEHGPGREGGEVLDRLHPRDGSLSLLECVRPGPQA